MKACMHYIVILSVVMAIVTQLIAERRIRVATYNIKYLDADRLDDQGDRQEKLQMVLEALDADIIALQEIDDRRALLEIFDDANWDLIIDDNSGENQDVALAVRHPLTGHTIDGDLNADDDDFLFSTSPDTYFPDRRDVLTIRVNIPDLNDESYIPLTIMVIHAKARAGGRANTDYRREGASERIVERIEQDFEGQDFIILGDFNDTPDDRSLNILETGNIDASAGPEEIQGTFLINLTEQLWAEGNVTHGLNSAYIVYDQNRVNTINPDARTLDNSLRDTNQMSGDIMFDQILVPIVFFDSYINGSAQVFNGPDAVRGNNNTRASDHVPVYADFIVGDDETPIPGDALPAIRISSVLPNPHGADRDHEQVTIFNDNDTNVDISGWTLVDRAGHEFTLNGNLEPNSERVFTLSATNFSLNNSSNETITLFNQIGTEVHDVSYLRSDVREGETIQF